jgi:acetoacetate decarboxylase
MFDLEELMSLDDEELQKRLKTMDHHSLLALRQMAGRNNTQFQNKLAGPEHRAWAREYVGENPYAALPVAMMTMAYQPYKMLQGGSRSQPSLQQMMQGLTGIGEGLKNRFF